MKKIVIFGNLPIASKVAQIVNNRHDTKLCAAVIGKQNQKNFDPWENVPIFSEYAKNNDIPTFTLKEFLNNEEEFDIGLSARFNRIIPIKILKRFKEGVINFHGGLLPEFAGLYSSTHTILESSIIGGGTLHYMTEEIDGGTIIARCEFTLDDLDTSISIFQKTQIALYNTFKEIFPKLISGKILSYKAKYSSARNNYYNKSSLEGLKNIQIDNYNKDIHKIVRAFDFPTHEPAYIEFQGQRVYLTTRRFFEND